MRTKNGVTLLELMIATLMIALVFAVAISLYSTGSRFVSSQNTNSDPTTNATVILEDIAKRISICNQSTYDSGTGTLHLRCDYTAGTYTPRNTPSNFADDAYWHYRFFNGNLLLLSNNVAGSVPNGAAAGEIIIPGVNVENSSFARVNATGAGTTVSTRIDIRVTTSSAPVSEVRTSAILGAAATR